MGVEVIKDIPDTAPDLMVERIGAGKVDKGCKRESALPVEIFVFEPRTTEQRQKDPAPRTMLIIDLPGPGGDTTNRRSADDFPAL